MAATSLKDHTTCPFLLKLFYRTGAFHRPDEFSAPHLPASLSVYTFPTCSLGDLVYHLAAAEQAILPSPAVGTRIVFRLVYADTRGAVESSGPGPAPRGPARFVVKDLGSVVVGWRDGSYSPSAISPGEDVDDRSKTLADARFVVGDYISCAILAPLSDGSVAPVSAARSGRGSGIGEGQTSVLPPGRSGGFGGGDGYGWRNEPRRMKRGGQRGGSSGKGSWLDSRAPEGEWRRGEEVPDRPVWDRGGRGRGGRW